ncbi:MAG: endolytic transglycosylase MltG [Candidatus Nomurabacteria bacterium]|jgi:UPF0755 protein|nr:endolytic transglycosylase MltG [Candidatus Nomurabacteria bacterium]
MSANKLTKKPIIIALTSAVAVLLALFVVFFSVNLSSVNADDKTVMDVEIRGGASIEEVAANLNSKRLIKNQLAFVLFARLTGVRVEAGLHKLSPNMSVPEMADKLRTAGQDRYNLMILPEMTIPEIKAEIKKYDFSEAEIEAAFAKRYDHPLLAGRPDGFDLEGYIFPDTYEMRTADSVEDLLTKVFDNLYNKLKSDGSLAQMAARDLTIYETLTLASIVAREVPTADEQKKVAGVFWNRLDHDIVLGSDVTFQYAFKMGYCDVNGPSCQSKYNTRLHPGLPPGPISNMKYAAIRAVLEPTNSDFFYFLAGDDGQIYYARTEDEHQSNIVNHCQEMCR